MYKEIDQSGAAIPGNHPSVPARSWSQMLSEVETSVVQPTRKLIGSMSACKVSALDVIKATDREELLSLFVRLTGQSGRLNPFLSEDDSEDEKQNEYLLKSLNEKYSRAECEENLQLIMRSKMNTVVAIHQALRMMPVTVVYKVKSMLADSLECEEEKSVWYCWNQYIGCDTDDLSADEQIHAARSLSKWWQLMTKVYDRIVKLLLDNAQGQRFLEENVDIEVGIREWRNLPRMCKGASNYEEVFLREKLIYNNYRLAEVSGMNWEKRRELLNMLILRKELQLESIVDVRRVSMTVAENYDQWWTAASEVLRLAEAKGWTLDVEMYEKNRNKKAKEKEAAEQKKNQNREWINRNETAKSAVPQQHENNRSQAKPTEYKRMYNFDKDQCMNCGQHGHWAKDCPSKVKTDQRSTQENQVSPASSTKITPGAQSSFAARPTAAVPKSAPPTPKKDDKTPYQTAYGRTVHKPKSMVTFAVPERTERAIPSDNDENIVLDDQVVEIPEDVSRSLRTIGSEVFVTENVVEEVLDKSPVSRAIVDMAMPHVEVVIESIGVKFDGLLDTASNLNFISQRVFRILKEKRSSSLAIEESKLVVQTMVGSQQVKDIKRVNLNLAIMDSLGEISSYRNTACLVYDEESIPGGADLLLASDWITHHKLLISSLGSDFVIKLPECYVHQEKAIQTSHDDVPDQCLFSVNLDGPEIEDAEDDIVQSPEDLAIIMESMPREALRIGPLKEDQLKEIKADIHDPELELCFQPGKLEPPVRELGYACCWSKQAKLFEHIKILEQRDILEEVPPGTGKYYSPGFAVKKSNDRIRLVVRYVSLNSRLELPKGIRYHDAVSFKQSIPSYCRYFMVLDVKDAFHRIPVSEAAKPYLNMSVYHPNGYKEYAWKRAPQGLSVSPAFWVQLIDSTVNALKKFLLNSNDQSLRNLLDESAICIYADDLLVASRDVEKTKLLGQVLRQTLMYNQMWVPVEKMQEGFEVVINGLRLRDGMMFPKEEVIEKIRSLRKPKDKDELRSALGLLNYVKWSSPLRGNASDNSWNVLLDMIQSRKKFLWSDVHDLAWKKLVEDFYALPLFSYSTIPGIECHEKSTLVIQSDASLTGIGFSTFVIPKIPDYVYDHLSKFSLQDYVTSMKLIAVGSKKLSSTECMYIAHDREALGLFHALSENRALIYLFDSVIVQTDSKTALSKYLGNENPLDVIGSASTCRGRRWLRWLSDLGDLLPRVRWIHISGKDNSFADYLSRYCMDDLKFADKACQTNDSTQFGGGGIGQSLVSFSVESSDEENLIPEFQSVPSETPALSVISEDPVENLSSTIPSPENFLGSESEFPEISRLLCEWSLDDHSLYLKDIKLQWIFKSLCGDPIPEITPKVARKISEVCKRRFSIFDTGVGNVLLFHNNKYPVVVVPDNRMHGGMPLRTFLVKFVHEVSPLASHRGIEATLAQLRRTFWFPRMDSSVKAWINSCLPCTIVKSNRTSGTFHSRKLQYVNQLIVCDWCGPLEPSLNGERYCLIIVDAFSGFTFALPFKNKNAFNVVEGMLTYAALFGYPESFSSDNDPSFVGAICSQLRQTLGISSETIPTYSPATSGVAEEAVKKVKQTIAVFSQESEIIDWPVLLRGIMFCANSTPRYHSDICPFLVMFGRTPVDPLNVSYGFVPERNHESLNDDEYVKELKAKLSEITSYWQSKVMESRNKATDATVDDLYCSLEPGDICVRVSYVSGRRRVHGRVKILNRVEGSSDLFNVFNFSLEKNEVIGGHHLIKQLHHPDRQYPAVTNYESFYLIEDVLRYEPSKGYLVHWLGYPSSEDSWQKAKDMPLDPWIQERMRQLRLQRRNS